jgi:hypothetical protein
MPLPHLFEFMDQDWVPASLRSTLREILECGNARPFRPYYQWVKDEVLRTAQHGGFRNIVELGAGTAPITRLLADEPGADQFRLIPCDRNPDCEAYRLLEQHHPGIVAPLYTPVDFTEPRQWDPDTLLFLSATFHHVPVSDRAKVLTSLTSSSRPVMIFEPLRKSATSVAFVFGSVVPALVLPVWFLPRPGRFRRFLWCWLVPLAPLMFWWDGVVSCFRQWTESQWRATVGRLNRQITAFVTKTFSYYLVVEPREATPVV